MVLWVFKRICFSQTELRLVAVQKRILLSCFLAVVWHDCPLLTMRENVHPACLRILPDKKQALGNNERERKSAVMDMKLSSLLWLLLRRAEFNFHSVGV